MKKWLLPLFLLLFASYLVIGYKIPNELFISRINTASANNHVLLRVLTQSKERRGWWPQKGITTNAELLSYKSYRFSFLKTNDNNISIRMITGSDTLTGNIRIVMQETNLSTITWTCTQTTRENIFTNVHYYIKAQRLSKIIDRLLKEVKDYAEDTERLYGFSIQKEHLQNDIITVSTHYVKKDQMYLQLQKSFKALNTYIQTNKLQATGNYMVSISNLTKDSVTVMTGIPTNNFATPAGNINHTQMPPGGNMVTAMYKGMYKNRADVFKALEAYVTDNELSKASLPYESHLNNTIPLSDSSVVEMKIYYPVF